MPAQTSGRSQPREALSAPPGGGCPVAGRGFCRRSDGKGAWLRTGRQRALFWGAVLWASLFLLWVGPGRAEAQSGGGAPGALNPFATFEDLSGHWARGYVDSLLAAGVLDLEKEKKFRPEEPVTRLDFAVWVARALELEPGGDPGLFLDWGKIPEEARPWVAAAVYAGLVQGYPRWDGTRTFEPEKPITRAELATLLGRSLIRIGARLETRYLYLFEDRTEIPAWAEPAAAAVKEEVLLGRPGIQMYRFAPQSLTKRGEAAVLINRFMNARLRLLPELALRPQPLVRPRMVVSGYFYRCDPASRRSLQQAGERVNLIYYFGFSLNAQGELGGYPCTEDLDLIRSRGVPALLVVTNGFDKNLTTRLLSDPEARKRALDQIVKRVEEQGWSGVNLDFENVSPQDRELYSAFVEELSRRLRPQRMVTVAVPLRKRSWENQSWARAYDYRALGRVSDFLVIMGYDQHWAGAPPGPIGERAWLEEGVDYAVSVVPPEKVVLGLPSYAYDWPDTPDCPPERRSTQRCMAKGRPIRDLREKEDFYSVEELIGRFGVEPRLDPARGEAYFRYVNDQGEPRIVYFTPGEGLRLKLELVSRYGLGGVAMWRMGFEPESFWVAFRDLYEGRIGRYARAGEGM